MADTADRAGIKEWLGLAVLALPTLVLAIDATVLYLALPQLGADLRPSGAETLWIVDIYGFMIAGFLITMGSVGDRVGRRKLLMTGAVAFGAASVLAAYASEPAVLIAARALLGIAGATLMPSTLSLISNMFHDPTQRGFAIAIWASCFSAGVALGPLIGGLLLQYFWWGSVFLLAVPVMLLLLVSSPFLLPDSRDPQPGEIDFLSVLLSLAAILPIVFGFKLIAAEGFGTVSSASIIGGLICGAVFIHRQLTLANPLLDVRLFSRPAFLGTLLALLIGLAAVGVTYMFVTQYLQMVENNSPLRSGLWLLPSAVAMIASSMIAQRLVQRFEAGQLVAGALIVSAAGYALLGFVDGPGDLTLVVISLVVVYTGIGPLMALGTNLVVSAAPPRRAGSAAAMSETAMELGLALGIAVLGSVGMAVYRSQLPSGIPAESSASLANALAVLGDNEALLQASKYAFTSGLSIVGWISAAATAAISLALLALSRRSGSSPNPELKAAMDSSSARKSPEPSN
ncbi:MAG: MFS transporter [Rhodococcus sp. (in: high G+C Gram-positive bacteria)]|uniref:MFS transporter n=1 Tax=unclassified Rhodococcus (in: high G+C Gram-positive bacteria) TaxID=192944 RepID=UPI000B2EB3CB|nr:MULTISPECIES: MFS transporter [unclassified Rhodococcus (in: high G+C Gram-positive bacteria)]